MSSKQRDTDFGRLITAMVTPFKPNEDVDYLQAQRLVLHLRESGTTSVVVCGTTGESPTLSVEEKLELFSQVAFVAQPRGIKVIAGTGSYNTRESIRLTKEASELDVDGVLLVVPYYNNPPQEGLYRHFRAIAESTDLPCIVYNVPSRTTRNMDAATTIRLAKDVPNIVGIKEASESLDQVMELMLGLPPDFSVWSGNDNDIFFKMCAGAYGVVSVASHIVGGLIKGMIDEIVAGHMDEARRLQHQLWPIAKQLFPPLSPVASPASIKAALNLLGMDVGGLRLPMVALPVEAAGKLEAMLRGYNGLLDTGLYLGRGPST